MIEKTRPISWIKVARKDFEGFPMPVQTEANRTLTVAAEGRKADNVKPLKRFDSGIMEIVLRHRGDAFRVMKEGIKTPKYEIDLVHERLKRLKEILR
jgi:phage-related protein